MTPEDDVLFQQAKDWYNAGRHQKAYQQFCEIHQHGNTEDTSLLCWLGYSTPNLDEAQRALADVERLKPNHPSLPKLRERVKKLQPPRTTSRMVVPGPVSRREPMAVYEQPPQPVSNTSAAETDRDESDKDTSTEKPTTQPVATPPRITHWRKVSGEQWQPIGLPLPEDEHHELVFIHRAHFNQFKCANCGKSLNETPYVWCRTRPRTAVTLLSDKRYCIEHSPIPIETRTGPTIGQHVTTLFKIVTGLTQRFMDLEQRVAELEARMGSDQDSPGQQDSE